MDGEIILSPTVPSWEVWGKPLSLSLSLSLSFACVSVADVKLCPKYIT
jgi:hypothetical protein